jgi:Protein of unknown function (DUF1236)
MGKAPPMDQTGTQRLMLIGALVSAILLVAMVLWPLLTSNPLGNPLQGSNPSANDTTSSRDGPAQQAAESTVGKNDPAGQEDATGGRARAIKETSKPLSLTAEQIQQVRSVLNQEEISKIEKADFEMMIGVSVPKQIELRDIPPRITEIMNGYWGDQYTLVQDKLVIVDQNSRRIVAIIPEMT